MSMFFKQETLPEHLKVDLNIVSIYGNTDKQRSKQDNWHVILCMSHRVQAVLKFTLGLLHTLPTMDAIAISY